MRNPLLVSERVYLRPEEPGDAERMASFYANEVDDFTDDGGRRPISPIMMKQLIEQDAKKQPPDSFILASCLRETDDLIGWVGCFDVDVVNLTAETMSFFAPGEYRSRGYGTESKFLLLEYCFDWLGLEYLQSYVYEANARSAAALRKQGYRPAGRLKWSAPRRGVYLDTLLFDINRDEWLEARTAYRESLQV